MTVAEIFLAADGRLRAGWRLLLFFPVLFAFLFVLGVTFWFLAQDRFSGRFEWAVLVGGIWSSLSAGLAAYVLLRIADRRSFRTLGLWFYGGWGGEFFLGFAGGSGLVSLVVFFLWLGGQLQFNALLLDLVGVLSGLGWTLFVFLPPAAFEELVFRGYPFQRLVEGAGTFLGVFILSVLFGLLHLGNPNATPLSTANTVLIGVLLALSYLKTRGLWLPLGFHWAWNVCLGFVYSLPVSGYEFSQKLFEVEISGPKWISGGNYGPEGSVLTTAAALAAIAWLARTRHLGVSPQMARELE